MNAVGEKKAAQVVSKLKKVLSPEEKHKRKQRVLTQGTPSITNSIADAVVIKNENIYFLTQTDGNVPLGGNHGFGLYFDDCRYLNGYVLKIADTEPNVLVSNASEGFMAVHELTNPEIQVGEGKHIPVNEIGIKLERIVDAGDRTLFDLISLRNYGRNRVEFPISLTFQAEFEDVFSIRGLLLEQPGKIESPTWKDGALSFDYVGADKRYRSLCVHFSPTPDQTSENSVQYKVGLDSEESTEILVSLVIEESDQRSEVEPKDRDLPDLHGIKSYFRDLSKKWLSEHTEVHSDSLLLNQIIERSLRDLRTLRSSIGKDEFFAAGVPWFVTLFGRDSIITAIQSLAYNPEIAAETLRLLADYQGKEENEYRDEQPGKILHELRVGELAQLGEIPHTPYYGTVDATPLFIILLAQHAAWTGELNLFSELRKNVEQALEWIDNNSRKTGYTVYQGNSNQGLVNQGWKDSGDAIVNADGSLATPPISLVEVQGYVYLAKKLIADLYERAGETARADQLRQEAKELSRRFNRDFWLEDLGFYALALQAENKPAAVVSSNPGQALWTGIVEHKHARQTVERLVAEDMFTGWGIRTLSEKERTYNPIGYHLGTVWPHDNAIIAAGFRRYGFNKDANRIFTGIVEAAMQFQAYRLPELFAGFRREDYSVPVRYPVACHPQAWSAGSVPYLVQTFLGLEPEAFEKRLRIVHPILPEFVDRLELRGLRVGRATADLSFERTSDQRVAVKIIQIKGKLDIVLGSEF